MVFPFRFEFLFNKATIRLQMKEDSTLVWGADT